jgi:hypothetical protein
MKRIAPKGSSETFLRSKVGYRGDDCVLWPFRTCKAGYGLAVIGGVQKRASRWMCVLAHGSPPSERYHAAHSCGIPACVNPKHLRWAMPVENMADKNLHGTSNHGERNGKTKLTENDIRAIRSAPPDLKRIMGRFGISKGCVSKIRSRSRWGHVR